MKTQHLRESAGVVIGTVDKHKLVTFIDRFLGLNTEYLIDIYEDLFFRIKKHEGTLQASIRAKKFYDAALRYAAGLEVTPIPFIKSDKDGFPRALKAFKKHLDGSLSSKRAALTILQLYKLVESKADFSTDSITGEYKGTTKPWWLASFDAELRREFPEQELQRRVSMLKPSLHVSGKKGPNGPALMTAPIDREAIRGTELEYAIGELAKLTENVYLDALLVETFLEPLEQPTHRRRKLSHSTIRLKHEPGGKTRVFCVCDYFSQSALSPIHNYLMDWLRNQPQDGTNEHSKAALAVKDWTDGRYGKNLWSFDLTTATDRYPRFLERRVLEAVFGEEIARNWEVVIASRQFDTPNGGTVEFATGQPLGALSSWAAFAVTHHIHIRTAGRLCGRRPLYRMIGDDITIAKDKEVAQLYISMMTDLNVPFSGPKSILPLQMKGFPVAELAKRVFCNGAEITPIPPDAILEGVDSPIGLKNLLETAISRGYERASKIYPVQSAIPFQVWYPTLAFPIRNRLPQLNEVKLFRPIWENEDESPPAGINRGWFTWADFSAEVIEFIVKELLLSELVEGYEKAVRFRNTLYEWSLIGPDFEVEGGDWQPRPWEIHDTVLPRIADYMTERLEEVIEDMATAPSLDDPYRYIGGLHSFLEPRQAFIPSNFDDEKVKTRIFISKIIKKVCLICQAEDPVIALLLFCNDRKVR